MAIALRRPPRYASVLLLLALVLGMAFGLPHLPTPALPSMPHGAWVVSAGEYSFVARIGPQEQPAAQPLETAAVVPRNDIEATVVDAANQFGVSQPLALALLAQESGGNPNSVSSAGARGLMQIMPSTAAGIAQELGISSYNLDDPTTNARFGMYYLKGKLDRYGHDWGLAAYNWGPNGVDTFLSIHPEAAHMPWSDIIARWGSEIPIETQNYVTNISAMEQQTHAQQTTPTGQAFASNPITIGSDAFGVNVRAALNANDGALQNVTINPGDTWSFNASVGNPALLSLATIAHPGDGWCNLAARYAQVARPLGLTPRFEDHGVGDLGGGPENSVAIWNIDGQAGSDGEKQDLQIANTLDRPVHFQAQQTDGDVVIVAWEG